jgi:hypothetical protein
MNATAWPGIEGNDSSRPGSMRRAALSREWRSGRGTARYPESAACDCLRRCGFARIGDYHAGCAPQSASALLARRLRQYRHSSDCAAAACRSFAPTAFQHRRRRTSRANHRARSHCPQSSVLQTTRARGRTGHWQHNRPPRRLPSRRTSGASGRGLPSNPHERASGRRRAMCREIRSGQQMAGGLCGSVTAVMSCPSFHPWDCRKFWPAPFLPGRCVRVTPNPGVTCSRICRPTRNSTRASIAG